MATQIQIKRGAATAETAPGTLAAGELAVTYGDAAGQANGGDRLYIGNSPGNANLVIGGKYFTDLIDHVHGTLTASSGLIADASSKLDNIKVDNLDLNANTLSTTNTNGELVLSPHGTAGVGILAGGSSTAGTLKLYEGSTNGSHSIAIKPPASLAADVTLTLPADDGSANQALMTNGSGVLTWGGALTAGGAISGTTGTFTSTVVGVAGTFSGAVSGTTGTFSDAVAGTAATFTGLTITDGVRVGVTADNEIDTVSGNLVLDSAGGTITVDDNITIASSKTIDMGANKVTGVAEPVAASDAATKAYVDAVKTGLDVKDSVRVATTANITIATALNNADTLDGVTLATNDRILVKNQTTGSENGIYVVAASPARATDFDASAEVSGGAFTFVEEGTVNADSGWVVTTNGAITVGSTALSFAQFSGAGQITAGTGLTKSGNTINAVGSTTIFAAADALEVNSNTTQYNVLLSGGTAGVASTFGQLPLNEGGAVTGILAVANGGTGVNTIAANLLMTGDGSNAVNTVAVGSSGQVLLSAGAGTDPSFGHVDGGTF
jgi:hypothetical protein